MRKADLGDGERITVRLPKELALGVRQLAHEADRTLNADIARGLRAYVEARRKEEYR